MWLYKDFIRNELRKERRLWSATSPLFVINPCCCESSFGAREGLVCPVICYSVNHISGEMDLLACPLQRNEGQPLPPRCHLQHDAIANAKHRETRAGWNKNIHIQRWKEGVGGLVGQSAGFSCSFAPLFLSLTWIKCCRSGCERTRIPEGRHSSEGKFLSLTLKITGAPQWEKNLWHVWFYTWHRSTEIFSKTAPIKFNSLENAYFFWRHVRLTFLES